MFCKMNGNGAPDMKSKIEIHNLTENPTEAWNCLRPHKVVKEVVQMNLAEPVHADRIRFVCVSDTHNNMGEILDRIPPGDAFIHAGDFTFRGQRKEVEKFNEELGKFTAI